MTSQASSDSIFAGWSGDDDCSDGRVTMNSAKTCTSAFTRYQPTLYEISHQTGTANGWYGGDDRDYFGPRNYGVGQSVLIHRDMTVDRYSVSLTSELDYAQNPDGFGHEVTLILNIRNTSGSILQRRRLVVPRTFSGGWVTWTAST